MNRTGTLGFLFLFLCAIISVMAVAAHNKAVDADHAWRNSMVGQVLTIDARVAGAAAAHEEDFVLLRDALQYVDDKATTAQATAERLVMEEDGHCYAVINNSSVFSMTCVQR